MRRVTYIVAIGTLAAAVTGCADPYAPRSGYSPGYNYPSSYSYPANNSSGYYPTRYGYGPSGDYNRNYGNYGNYSGARSGPQVTLTVP
jgi:hypothetical protein